MTDSWLEAWATSKGRRIHAHLEEEMPKDGLESTAKRRGRPKSIKSNVTERERKRIYDNRYRNKNRFEINRRERAANATPKGAFKKCRKKAR